MKPLNLTVLALLTFGWVGGAWAATEAEENFSTGEPVDPKHSEYLAVKFQQKLNEQVDLDLKFRNQDGTMVTLRQLADGKPVILSLVYYRCPGLCNLSLEGLRDALSEVRHEIGDQYEVITLSFDHRESHALASQKRNTYLQSLDRPGAQGGWHFLVGDEVPVQSVADSVGFEFKYNEEVDHFSHGSGIVFLTKDGIISRYLPGWDYPKRDVEFSLIAASKGEIGSMVSKLFATCYAFDPSTGKYNRVINIALTSACIATVILMSVMLFFLIRMDRKHNKPLSPAQLEALKLESRNA